MAFHVRDPETDTLVRDFARSRGVGVTEAVKLAVQEAVRAQESEADRRYRRGLEIIERVAALPATGLKADKAFYDSLNDDDD